MCPIVEIPTVVREAMPHFSGLFSNEPERVHLSEYVTGLLVARKKNVSAISREFAHGTDQSCLNRWVNEVEWDEKQLNQERLAWLQRTPALRYSAQGVIALDNVLIDHEGKLIEDVGLYWDHADKRYLVAHDYLIANYVCSSGQHYPLEFRRFVKKTQCEEREEAFRDHNELFRELVDWCIAEQISADFTFDCWFTHAANLNHIQAAERGYVGDLKFNRKVEFKGRTLKAAELATEIQPANRKKIEVGDREQWYFTKTVRLPDVDHPVRILILWPAREATQASKILVSNRTHWEASRMVRVYRQRWRGTECFHRDGKQELGMGDCQLRNGRGQTRHLYLVFLAHSILMRQLRQNRVYEWALERLMTIGEACRAVQRETFSQTLTWVVERVQKDDWNIQHIKTHFALP